MRLLMARCVSVAALVTLSGCGDTLFRSDFDQTQPNQPPATAQAVGTAAIHGPAGSVLVVAPPVTPSGRWVKIERPTGPQVAGFQGNLIADRGDGEYTFTTTVFMPTGTGVSTIQFERFGHPVGNTEGAFLHLDLTPENNVRIDDQESSRFGMFPRDQPFIVQVELNIGASSSAHIVLSGTTAKGEADRAIPAVLNDTARHFGAVRLWMGFPHTGRFNATNVVVKRE